MRPTVCKVCNSARRTHPPYGVQPVPFRMRPGLPRNAPPRCARCAIRRAGHTLHTVCNVCHSGCGPDLRGVRPTVCKVCHSVRRARPPYGVQPVPFRVRPGPPRDAPDGVQGVPFGAPDPPPIRCATCAIPGAARTSAGCAPRCARCAIRRAGHAPHTVCNVCHSAHHAATGDWRLATGHWPPATGHSVQGVPFRARPGLSRDATDGVQGVQFGAPRVPVAVPAAGRVSRAPGPPVRTAPGSARRPAECSGP